jgi:hypothetical protein
MSTYLSNSPTFLPTIQPFQPDMQLYAGTLEMKQTKFDAASKQISNLYGSLLNSPLTRDQNVKTRDDFFKTIDYEIKKVANLDLSLQENVNQATQLFTSLYDDKNLVKDMMWTKNLRNQMERGDNFRNCFDPDKCGGEFWQGGLDVLNYRAQEFKNLNDQDAMNFSDVRYVPYINIEKEARKIINEKGYEPMTQEQILGNGYIVSTTNGPDVAGGPLMQLFAESFKNDPKLQDYYRASAYLERKNWVASNAEQYGSPEAAEQIYIQEKRDAINQMFAPAKEQVDFNKEVQTNNKQALEEKIRKEGTTGSDDLARAYIKTLEKENDLSATSSLLDESLNAANSTRQTTKISYAGEAIDGSWGNALFNSDLQKAAIATSWIGYKQTFRTDDKYMQDQARASAERIAAMNASAKKKKDEEDAADFWNFGPELGDPTSAGPGANAINLSETAAGDLLNKETKSAEEGFEKINKKINQTLYNVTKEDSNSGYNKQGQSTSDLLIQTDALIREYVSFADRGNNTKERQTAANLLKMWEGKDVQSQLGWAKASNFDWMFERMDEASQHNLYKQVYQPLATGDPTSLVNREYLKPHIQTLYPQLQQASNAYVVKNSWEDIRGSLYTGAINKLTGTADEGPMQQFFPYLAGNKGLRSANQFALAYAFDKAPGAQWKIDPTKKSTSPLPAWMEEASKAPVQRKIVEYDVVDKTGETKKQKRYADNNELVYDNQSLNKAILQTQGKMFEDKAAKVIITDRAGKEQKIWAANFFTDDYDIAPEYEPYAANFKFDEKTANGVALNEKFREAKWAWAMGDKKDAWEKNEDGTYRPNPYKEKTTRIGRGFGIPGPGSGYVTEQMKNIFVSDYFDNFTNYNSDYNKFYGDKWEGDIPLMHREINRMGGQVEIPGGNIFQALADMGSFSARPLKGKFSVDSANNGMNNKMNLGLWQYIQASKAGGIGTATGYSIVQAGWNENDPKHNDQDAALLTQFLELSVANTTDDKGKLSLLYTYSNVGGGKEDMQAMTIVPVFEGTSKSLLTTMVTQALGKPADDQEVIDYIQKITTQGITMYQPDIVAENYKPSTKKEAILGDLGGHYLYNTTKRQTLEKVMDITGMVQVPGYSDMSDITITRKGGLYTVQGKIQTGFDEATGQKMYHSIPEKQYDIGTPLADILYNNPMPDAYGNVYAGINGVLQAQRSSLIAEGRYRSNQITRDPSYVPDLWMQQFGEIKQAPAASKTLNKSSDPIYVQGLNACFSAETTILMHDFTKKAIYLIQEGDMVMSQKNNQLVKGIVTKALKHTINDVIPIVNYKELKAEVNHPVLINNEWKPISELQEGVIKLEFVDFLYNLEIDGNVIYESEHNYITNNLIVSGLGDNEVLNDIFRRQELYKV